MNELKLTQVELFSFFHFICVAANASELFCMAHLANIDLFLYHSNLSVYMHVNSPVRKCAFSLPKCVKLTQVELFSIFKSERILRVQIYFFA